MIRSLAGIDLIHSRLDSQVGLQVRDQSILQRKEGGREGEASERKCSNTLRACGQGGREGGRKGGRARTKME